MLVTQRLQAQDEGELLKAKGCMSAEVEELAALLQRQGQERLHQAQLRLESRPPTVSTSLLQGLGWKWDLTVACIMFMNHMVDFCPILCRLITFCIWYFLNNLLEKTNM